MDGTKIALLGASSLALLAHLVKPKAGRQPQTTKRGGPNIVLAPVPAGFSADPADFWGSGMAQDVRAWAGRADDTFNEDVALYHVTTALSKVLSSRLKSRAQLRAQVGDQARSFGLGGGEEQADRVSVGVTLDGARRVALALQSSILAAQGKLSGPDAATAVLRWTGFPQSIWTQDINARNADGYHRIFQILVGTDALEYEPEEVMNFSSWDWRYHAKQVDKGLSACDVFGLICTLEDEIFSLAVSHGVTSCVPVARVMEPCENIAKMNANEVAVLAVAGRIGSKPTEIESECELRFRPEDLVVLGVMGRG